MEYMYVSMNSRLIRRLPTDMQREIYNYMPLQQCIVCKGIVLNYSTKKIEMVCSMSCLYIFNQNMIMELALHRVAVPIFNMFIACNYVYIKLIIFLIFLFLGYDVVSIYCFTFAANVIGGLWILLI